MQRREWIFLSWSLVTTLKCCIWNNIQHHRGLTFAVPSSGSDVRTRMNSHWWHWTAAAPAVFFKGETTNTFHATLIIGYRWNVQSLGAGTSDHCIYSLLSVNGTCNTDFSRTKATISILLALCSDIKWHKLYSSPKLVALSLLKLKDIKNNGNLIFPRDNSCLQTMQWLDKGFRLSSLRTAALS